MGLWDLRTGALVSNFSRARVGAVITASALSRDLRTLAMAESDYVRTKYVFCLFPPTSAGVRVEPASPSDPLLRRRAGREADLVHSGRAEVLDGQPQGGKNIELSKRY